MSMPSATSMPIFATAKPAKSRTALGGPDASNMPAQRGFGRTVTVVEGDSLMSIGRRYDVPMSVLMEHNNLRRVSLTPGQELFVPQMRRSPPQQ
jgi:LysM domain